MTDDNVAAAEISKWKLDFVVVLFLLLFFWKKQTFSVPKNATLP